MSCTFCDSFFHLSKNCENYVTNGEREKAAAFNNRCQFCLELSGKNHKTYENQCRLYRKCVVCFSREHHTCYCHERFTASNLFIPNIDRDLFLRFFGVFNLLEQFTFALSSENIFKLFSLKPLKIIDVINVDNESFKQYPESNVIAANELKISDLSSNAINIKILSDLIAEKVLILNIKTLKLKCVKISSAEFFQLLPPCLKILECNTVEVKFAETSFAKIIEKTPNLSELELHETNIEINDTWVNELMRHSCLNHMSKLSIHISSMRFDVVKLVDFITMNTTENLRIHLFIRHSVFSEKDITELIKSKFSRHFVELRLPPKDIPVIKISIYKCFCRGYKLSKTFTLRKFEWIQRVLKSMDLVNSAEPVMFLK